MKISAISDVHVKLPHDDADRLLVRFLTHPLVQDSDYVLLLGDIFDLMSGQHSQYLAQYAHLFTLLDELQKKGKKVYFFEGNHDVHLDKLFKKRWPEGEVILSQIPIIETIDGKTYYMSHGDEHEVSNVQYQNYKRKLLAPWVAFTSNYILPFWLFSYIGNRASKKSRKTGAKTFNEEAVKKTFEDGVFEVTKGQYDFVLGGHSHVKDEFALSESSTYLNNGYALRSQTFIHIDGHKVSFPSLA